MSESVREYWVDVARRLADPVLNALAERRLKATMSVEVNPAYGWDRAPYTHLEAMARLLCGLAPWLELGVEDSAEGKLRGRYADLAREALDAATDPASPDRMNFEEGGQPLVDAGFLGQTLLRAPVELIDRLDPRVRDNIADCLVATRSIKPVFNNWLLFSATVEAALFRLGRSWDKMRIDYAVRQHEQWYAGDGAYGDGPHFHWDYYNSFVILPMLVDVLDVVHGEDAYWAEARPRVIERSRRYAAVLERMISPEGTFPPIGRSLAYRFGVLQSLGQMALQDRLPDDLSPAQARGAMTAVIKRMTEAPGTFDANGWLTLGFAGRQPSIAEGYISTGSLYLCAAGLLPLGLPSDHRFWTDPSTPWTSQLAWGGYDLPADKALP
jgi:hypothetical protein